MAWRECDGTELGRAMAEVFEQALHHGLMHGTDAEAPERTTEQESRREEAS